MVLEKFHTSVRWMAKTISAPNFKIQQPERICYLVHGDFQIA
jgi:hypothetical protein